MLNKGFSKAMGRSSTGLLPPLRLLAPSRPATVAAASAAALLALGAVSPAQAEFEALDEVSAFGPVTGNAWGGRLLGMPLTLDLKVRGFSGFNSNVTFISERPPFFGTGTGSGDANQSSAYIGSSNEFSMRMHLSPQTAVGAGLSSGNLYYIDDQRAGAHIAGADSPQDYNLLIFNPSFFVEHYSTMMGRPTNWRLAFDYRYESAAVDAIDSNMYRFTASNETKVSEQFLAGLTYEHAWIENRTFGSTSNQSRDGNLDDVTAHVTYLFPGGKRRVKTSFGYVNYDAEGAFFEYDGVKAAVDFETHLGGPFYAEIGTFAEWRDYDPSVVAGAGSRNRENLRGASTRIIWYLTPNFTADVYYEFEDIESNNPIYSGDRHNAGIGFTVAP